MKNNEIVAMLLAGGKGTRLESLTKKLAKPAVFFGGKYRIIDFPLSNCANSGISVVGILTQYESVALNNYIGNGSKWGIDGNKSLTSILAPRQTEEGANWYRGTADAIYRNLDFLDSINPKYVLILSGDHIYKMDYAKMLDFHKSKNADLTIAVINVSLEEASRFGIMNCDENYKVVEFEEKPKKPKSTLASMGIYIFNYKVLRDALNKDAKVEESSHDFGKNIIPNLLEKKKKVYAYRFDGYWKDVGTIQSLWEANMDMLDPKCKLDISDSKIKIFSEDTHSLPQYIGEEAKVSHSLLNQGSVVEGTVEHSVLFNEVTVEKGAKVIYSVVMPGTIIKSGVEVENAIIGPGLEVDENAEGTADHVLLINN